MIGGTVDSTSRTSMLFFPAIIGLSQLQLGTTHGFQLCSEVQSSNSSPVGWGRCCRKPLHIPYTFIYHIYILYIAIFIVIFRLKIYRSTGKSLPSPSGQRPRKSAAAVSVDLLARCQRLQRCGRLARCRSQAPVALQAAGGHWEAGLRCCLPLKMCGSG